MDCSYLQVCGFDELVIGNFKGLKKLLYHNHNSLKANCEFVTNFSSHKL